MKQIDLNYRQLEHADEEKPPPTHGPDTRSAEELLCELQKQQTAVEIQNNAFRVALIAFEESIESYVSLYDQSPVGYCTISEQGLILQANLTAATLLGIDRKELTNQPISRFTLNADHDIYNLMRKQLVKTGEPHECEFRMVKSDGTQFWAHLAAATAKDGDGAPVLRITLSDITNRKQLDEAVRKSERFMKTLTDSMPSKVGYWTKDLRAMFVNREHVNWFGKSQEEMDDIRIQDLLGEELFRKNEPYIRAALAGEIQEFERTLTSHNGEQRDTLVYYIPYRDDNEVLGFFSLVLDITERKHLEQALVSVAEEQQRVIGQELHDNLGQQIAAISYQAKALEKLIPASGNTDTIKLAASIAAQAQSAVMQCKQLAQGLLPFELEANELETALQALAARIASTYRVACDFICEGEAAIDDANHALNLFRIVQEAANNAIRHGHAQHLVISLSTVEGMLRLSISDDGCGFSADNAARGPGMGIKIMHYRTRQLGATLEFLPRAEGGTEVRIEMRAG